MKIELEITKVLVVENAKHDDVWVTFESTGLWPFEEASFQHKTSTSPKKGFKYATKNFPEVPIKLVRLDTVGYQDWTGKYEVRSC